MIVINRWQFLTELEGITAKDLASQDAEEDLDLNRANWRGIPELHNGRENHRARSRITFPNSDAYSSLSSGTTLVFLRGLLIDSTATPAFKVLIRPRAST